MTRLENTPTGAPFSTFGIIPKKTTAPGAKPTQSNQSPLLTSQKDHIAVSNQGVANPFLSLETEPEYILHTVKRGDSLGKIAKQYLGSTTRHPEIYQANRDELRNPNDLRIGMTLKIPVDTNTVPIDLPKPVTPLTPATSTGYTQYTVKRGESLSSISLHTLGDSERYMEIYHANQEQLKSPDGLPQGMIINIPISIQAMPSTAAPTDKIEAINASGLTAGAQELLAAMQRYQKHHEQLGNPGRTKTTPTQMVEIARELDSASQAFGVDPKMMLALFAHESGGINPGATSHTGAGGLGQLTGIAIRQVHFMAGIAKGYKGEAPFNQYKGNFVQSTRSISQRHNIKANIWTSVAYMSYELNERARLGKGVEKALKRYGDPYVPTYANKVSSEYNALFGGKLF